MDKIKKIIQIGSITDDVWTTDGNVLVFFDDESIEPIIVSAEDCYKIIDEYDKQNGNTGDLAGVINNMYEEGAFGLVDSNNEEEMRQAEAELKAAQERAKELQKGKISPVPIPVPPIKPEPEPIPPTPDDDKEELEEEVKGNSHTGRKIAAGVLAGAALAGAGLVAAQMINHNKDADKDNTNNNGNNTGSIDFNTATFEELMNAMDDNDPRKVVSQTALQLVQSFHDATHKDNNFRLGEDSQSYLDLSFEEALVLSTFANYGDQESLYQIFGSYNMSATQAQEILESAREKIIIYYMNAVEPSGLAEIFKKDEDKQFFKNFEDDVLRFNREHTTEASDQVIRDVYYNAALNGATNDIQVGAMAKLLSYNMVYGGLNLVESASTKHTQYLVFHGNGNDEELRNYITNVLGKDYDSLSETERNNYRTSIIENGTQLVSLNQNGETITEDNSTVDERGANVSLTNVVDMLGLCNAVNSEVEASIQALETLKISNNQTEVIQITTINNTIANQLSEAGFKDLSSKVSLSLNERLSDELLEEIRATGVEAAQIVENYEEKIDTIGEANRPTLDQISNAANRQLQNLENYTNTSADDMAILVNNRRHKELQETFEPDENGKVGEDDYVDKNGETHKVPVYTEEVIENKKEEAREEAENKAKEEGKTDEEIKEAGDKAAQQAQDEFVKENGEVIEEKHEEHTEEVKKEDLTTEEKNQVEHEIAVEEAKNAKINSEAQGGIKANEYANDNQYKFNPSELYDKVTGGTVKLNEMSFFNGIANLYAYSEDENDAKAITSSDAQIQNACEVAAENYLNSISQEQREMIAEGLGVSWENAREQLKAAFKEGYVSQMDNEINTAINLGVELRKQVETAYAENLAAEEAIRQAEQDNSANYGAVEETPSNTPEQNENSGSEEDVAPAPEENENSGPEGNESSDGNANDEEQNDIDPNLSGDDNIGEHFEPGEELVEGPDGESVEEEVVAPASIIESEPVAEDVPVEPTPDVEEADLDSVLKGDLRDAIEYPGGVVEKQPGEPAIGINPPLEPEPVYEVKGESDISTDDNIGVHTEAGEEVVDSNYDTNEMIDSVSALREKILAALGSVTEEQPQEEESMGSKTR